MFLFTYMRRKCCTKLLDTAARSDDNRRNRLRKVGDIHTAKELNVIATLSGRGRPARIVGGVLAALLLGAALTSCSGTPAAAPAASASGKTDWASVVKAAKAEGALTVYATQPGADTIFKKDFEAEYPQIKVTVRRQATGVLLPLLDQEIAGNVKSADAVFHAEGPWFAERGAQGALAPLVLSPENASVYKDYAGKFGAPIMAYSFFFGHNTKLGEPVSTIKDVADAAEKSGATIDFNDSGSSTALKNQYRIWEKEYPGILKRLAALPHVVTNGTQPMAQSMAAGEVAYGVGFVPGVIPPLAATGAPIAEDFQKDKTLGGVNLTVGVLANAPHPNAAMLFANFVMSKKEQVAMAKDWTPMVGFQVPSADLKFSDVQVYDPKYWTPARIQSFQDDWNALFKK
jgi:iron(III) transport system substrate-binding protein